MVPASIARATAAYREDSDMLGGWLAEQCEIAPGERVRVADAYGSFQQFFKDAGMIAPSRPAFVRRMVQRGFERKSSNGVPFLLGLSIRPPAWP